MPAPPVNPGPSAHHPLGRDERVFSSHPQVSLYFPSAAAENARARICRAIDRGDGPALVVGAAGTGKSLLLQVLATQYRQKFDVVLLACARICTRRALLQSILFELGLPYDQRDEGRLRLSLLDHLLSPEHSPYGLLLLVDEAQALPITLLDELRIMSNLTRAGVPRVRLVLAGSAALEETFACPDLESFSQRLSARCYLAPFSREETSQYIRAQLVAAGTRPENVFSADAFDAVFDASDGVPRLVNQLCDRALVLANGDKRQLVDRHAIQAAWADLQQLPMPWDSPFHATASPTSAHANIEFGSLDASPSFDDEPADIEPTELDGDDSGLDVAKVAPQPNNDVILAAETNNRRPRRNSHVPHVHRDSANPFGEQFEEEEIVLDKFAAWDDMFHRGTPRVENQRDRSLTTLVQAAIDAAAVTGYPPVEHTAGRDHAAPDEPETVAFEPYGHAAQYEQPPDNRPQLRLVEAPDTAAFDLPASRRPPASTIAARGWNSRSATAESPVLIVEDEPYSPQKPDPPLRRLAYQHLFSRLRSG